jgi:hypothetical protein
MKIRKGFVSNSSSSSFVISKEFLSPYQIKMIFAHGREAGDDAWTIEETDESISGDTIMDNFDMAEYLTNIGISNKFIKWDYER